MPRFVVTYTYSVEVEAEDAEDAALKAEWIIEQSDVQLRNATIEYDDTREVN